MTSAQEPTFQQVSGLWTAPVIESNADQVLRMQVSVGVTAVGELADEDVDLSILADGENLAQMTRPSSEDPLLYLQLRSISAVGHFVFANPTGAVPQQASVRIRDETATFQLGPSGDFPVA